MQLKIYKYYPTITRFWVNLQLYRFIESTIFNEL